MEQDLQEIYEAVCKIHPMYLEKGAEFDEIFTDIARDGSCCGTDALSRFTASLNDGHTNIEIPYREDSRCINAACEWEDGKLRIQKTSGEHLRAGDVVIWIGGMSTEEYFRLLSSVIPHENEYLVKSRSCHFPYANYHVFSAYNLRESEAVDLTLLREGKVLVVREKLVPYDGTVKFYDEFHQNHFEITENNVGVLSLYSCIDDAFHRKLLGDFFREVKERKVKDIVIDLSRNMGGNSNMIVEFFRYLDCDSYFGYGVYERRDNALRKIQDRNTPIRNNLYEDSRYKGRIYCNVGNDTFSAARMFAVLLKDNGLAVITGEPTGGKPSSCGAPVKLKTSMGQMKYRVSTRRFYRPDPHLDEEDTLMPEIAVPGADVGELLKKI